MVQLSDQHQLRESKANSYLQKQEREGEKERERERKRDRGSEREGGGGKGIFQCNRATAK